MRAITCTRFGDASDVRTLDGLPAPPARAPGRSFCRYDSAAPPRERAGFTLPRHARAPCQRQVSRVTLRKDSP